MPLLRFEEEEAEEVEEAEKQAEAEEAEKAVEVRQTTREATRSEAIANRLEAITTSS